VIEIWIVEEWQKSLPNLLGLIFTKSILTGFEARHVPHVGNLCIRAE